MPRSPESYDFDFIIGDWKAHVRRLPDRLNGSTTWIEYDGISRHHPILGSGAVSPQSHRQEPSSGCGQRMS